MRCTDVELDLIIWIWGQKMYSQNSEPDIPAALAMLNHLSNAELNEILNDEGKFEEIVKDIKQVICPLHFIAS